MKKFLLIVTASLLVGIVFYFIVRLNYSPSMEKTRNGILNTDVLAQLRFLDSELEKGADLQMQSIYPEGFLFIHALYGLTWANLIINAGRDSSVYREGIENIESSIAKTQSEKGIEVFQYDLPLIYGAFYRGWTNYLLAKKLEAQHPQDRDSLDILTYKNNCKEIYTAFESSEFVYMESYLGYVWPADNVVCLASLSVHDRIFPPVYQHFLSKKVSQMKTVLDTKTGLIPHSVAYDQVLEGARGSSQSLILVFLAEIDSDFAKQQYGLFKKHFLDHRLGLLGVREYPHETQGNGDIDAGPIVWEIGGSASIVSIASTYLNNDKELSILLRNSIETFGVPMTTTLKKKYLFGVIPMADAFIAWVNSFENPS